MAVGRPIPPLVLSDDEEATTRFSNSVHRQFKVLALTRKPSTRRWTAPNHCCFHHREQSASLPQALLPA